MLFKRKSTNITKDLVSRVLITTTSVLIIFFCNLLFSFIPFIQLYYAGFFNLLTSHSFDEDKLTLHPNGNLFITQFTNGVFFSTIILLFFLIIINIIIVKLLRSTTSIKQFLLIVAVPYFFLLIAILFNLKSGYEIIGFFIFSVILQLASFVLIPISVFAYISEGFIVSIKSIYVRVVILTIAINTSLAFFIFVFILPSSIKIENEAKKMDEQHIREMKQAKQGLTLYVPTYFPEKTVNRQDWLITAADGISFYSNVLPQYSRGYDTVEAFSYHYPCLGPSESLELTYAKKDKLLFKDIDEIMERYRHPGEYDPQPFARPEDSFEIVYINNLKTIKRKYTTIYNTSTIPVVEYIFDIKNVRISLKVHQNCIGIGKDLDNEAENVMKSLKKEN